MCPNHGLVVRAHPNWTNCTKQIIKKGEIFISNNKVKKENASRVIELVTYLTNPTTGEEILSIKKVDEIIETHPSIKEYAYIIHDKDTYTEEDEKNDKTGKIKCGDLKPAHIHLVMKFDRFQEIRPLSEWFGIPANFFEKKKGHRAFADAVIYLTHASKKEQLKGKYLYPEEEVTFSFRRFLTFKDFFDFYKENLYGDKNFPTKKQLREDVLYNGLSIRYIKKHYKSQYDDDMDALNKRRGDYLKDAPMPNFRFNIYITGDGGAGKGIFSEALSWSLIDDCADMDDEDVFCYVGNESVGFELYDGQPVLIWDDCRHQELFKKLNTRGNVFNVFDTKPKRIPQKKKFSQTNLVNTINIVNSVEGILDFLDGLAGKYKDRETNEIVEAEDNQKSQSYRRFPIRIEVFPEYYDLYYCTGYFDKSKSCLETEEILHINAPLYKLLTACGDNKALYHSMCKEVMKPIIDLYQKAKEMYFQKSIPCAEDITSSFVDLGVPGNQDMIPKIYGEKLLDYFYDYKEKYKEVDIANITNRFCSVYNIKKETTVALIKEQFNEFNKS